MSARTYGCRFNTTARSAKRNVPAVATRRDTPKSKRCATAHDLKTRVPLARLNRCQASHNTLRLTATAGRSRSDSFRRTASLRNLVPPYASLTTFSQSVCLVKPAPRKEVSFRNNASRRIIELNRVDASRFNSASRSEKLTLRHDCCKSFSLFGR